MGDEGFEHVVEVMGRAPWRSERPSEVSERLLVGKTLRMRCKNRLDEMGALYMKC